MTNPTSKELRQLSEQAQAFAPEAAEQRLPTSFLSLAPTTSVAFAPDVTGQSAAASTYFLSLAPTTSASYPKTPSSVRFNFLALTSAVPGDAAAASPDQAKRRSSSNSSSGSAKSGTGLRFLKLGPVHSGEHQDDHKADWYDVAVE